MRLHCFLLGVLLCAGCGGSKPSQQTDVPLPPDIYRTVIEAEGIPFEVSWDRNDRRTAQARVFGATDGSVIDPTGIIIQATGCKVTTVPQQVASDDGVPTYVADTNCAPARVLKEADASVSRELAREIDFAVALVAQEQAVLPTQSAAPLAAATSPEAVVPQATLYEGSPYSAFTASEIERYCAEDWATRIAADGRTEYNPCKRREVFR